MDRKLVAGVDSSTQSVKVVIRDADTGDLVRQGKAAHPDGTEVDPAHWLSALDKATEAAGGFSDVSAISVAGQQHGFVAIDKDAKVIRPALLWNDLRSAQAASDLNNEFGGNEQTAKAVGSLLVASFTVSKLRWMVDNEKDAGSWEDYANETRPADWDTDQDGLPNWWETAKGLNPNSDKGDFSDANAATTNGYTQLEDYLNWLALPHYVINKNETLELDLENLFKGYTKKPKYAIVKVDNGAASIAKKEIQFTATNNGFATVEVQVQDTDGDSMSRVINVFVK